MVEPSGPGMFAEINNSASWPQFSFLIALPAASPIPAATAYGLPDSMSKVENIGPSTKSPTSLNPIESKNDPNIDLPASYH